MNIFLSVLGAGALGFVTGELVWLFILRPHSGDAMSNRRFLHILNIRWRVGLIRFLLGRRSYISNARIVGAHEITVPMPASDLILDRVWVDSTSAAVVRLEGSTSSALLPDRPMVLTIYTPVARGQEQKSESEGGQTQSP